MGRRVCLLLPRALGAGAQVASLQGHDSTCGLVQFLEKPAAKDGVIVKVLKAQGAVPFVKTSIPQTLLRSLPQAGRVGGPGPGLGEGEVGTQDLGQIFSAP